MSQIYPRFGKGRHINSPSKGDLFDQPPGEMSSIWGKLADHIEDAVVLSPEEVVLVTSPGTESSYPRPPHPLEHSSSKCHGTAILGTAGRREDTDVFVFVLFLFLFLFSFTVVLNKD